MNDNDVTKDWSSYFFERFDSSGIQELLIYSASGKKWHFATEFQKKAAPITVASELKQVTESLKCASDGSTKNDPISRPSSSPSFHRPLLVDQLVLHHFRPKKLSPLVIMTSLPGTNLESRVFSPLKSSSPLLSMNFGNRLPSIFHTKSPGSPPSLSNVTSTSPVLARPSSVTCATKHLSHSAPPRSSKSLTSPTSLLSPQIFLIPYRSGVEYLKVSEIHTLVQELLTGLCLLNQPPTWTTVANEEGRVRIVPPAYKNSKLDNLAQEMDDALTRHWTLLKGSFEQQKTPDEQGKMVDNDLNVWRNHELRANFRLESHHHHDNISLVRTSWSLCSSLLSLEDVSMSLSAMLVYERHLVSRKLKEDESLAKLLFHLEMVALISTIMVDNLKKKVIMSVDKSLPTGSTDCGDDDNDSDDNIR